MNKEEQNAVHKIKTDSRYFFKYVRKFKSSKSASPEILIDSSEEVVTDRKLIADCFQRHFESVFSSPNDELNPASKIPPININEPLPDLKVSTQDVVKAINEIKMFSASPKNDISARLLKECKEALAVPLQLFWQKSFKEGKIPSEYKKQQITPLHKKGPRTQASNYRPISLTSHVIKIFERVLREKIVNYLETNGIINSNQHGFRKKHSCLTQLLSHTSYILEAWNLGAEVDSIYVDFSKAFDNRILLEKLKIYGITGKYHKWIESFLTGRKQVVRLENEFSYEAPVTSGVPQGSVLGPLLFVLYVNDISKWIKYSQLQTFADDTKICFPISTAEDRSKLQEDLNMLHEWSAENNMVLNPNKYELVCHKIKRTRKNSRSTRFLEDLPFGSEAFTYTATNDVTLYPSSTVRDLGVIVDAELNWKSHVAKIKNDSIKMCCWILNVFKARDKTTMLILFNSLVRTRLEFCSELWDPHEINQISSIEQVQRRFTKKIVGLRDETYWERLKILGILSLQRRRERQTIIHIWKVKNIAVRNDAEFQFNDDPIRRTQPNATLPRMSKTAGKVLSVSEHSFVVRSTKLWNKLPLSLVKETDHMTFIHGLDKFLKLVPDEPPVNGHYHNHKNSIREFSMQNYHPS